MSKDINDLDNTESDDGLLPDKMLTNHLVVVFKTDGRPWQPKIGLDQLNFILGK